MDIIYTGLWSRSRSWSRPELEDFGWSRLRSWTILGGWSRSRTSSKFRSRSRTSSKFRSRRSSKFWSQSRRSSKFRSWSQAKTNRLRNPGLNPTEGCRTNPHYKSHYVKKKRMIIIFLWNSTHLSDRNNQFC